MNEDEIHLAIGNDEKIEIYCFNRIDLKFEIIETFFRNSSNIERIYWLNQFYLLVLDSNEKITIFDYKLSKLFEFNLLNYFEFSNLNLSFQFCNESFFVIQNDLLIKFSLKNWKERIEYLCSINEWSLAIQRTIENLKNESIENMNEFLMNLFDNFINQFSNSISIWFDCLNYSLMTNNKEIVHQIIKKMLKKNYSFLESLILFLQELEDKNKLKLFELDFELVNFTCF